MSDLAFNEDRLAPNGTKVSQHEQKTDLKKSQIYLIWCQSDQVEANSDIVR